MAEHSVSHNGIIYIIPTDNLYRKYENSEAFIDKYGRLIDSKSKKVIKELEHKGALRSAVQRKVVIVQPPEAHPVRDAAKQAVADVMHEHIRRAVDWALDVGIPYLWHEHVVSFFHQTKEALTSKELKVDAILAETQASTDIAVKQQKTGVKMTQEEADAEKRKALFLRAAAGGRFSLRLRVLDEIHSLRDAGNGSAAGLPSGRPAKRGEGILSLSGRAASGLSAVRPAVADLFRSERRVGRLAENLFV